MSMPSYWEKIIQNWKLSNLNWEVPGRPRILVSIFLRIRYLRIILLHILNKLKMIWLDQSILIRLSKYLGDIWCPGSLWTSWATSLASLLKFSKLWTKLAKEFQEKLPECLSRTANINNKNLSLEYRKESMRIPTSRHARAAKMRKRIRRKKEEVHKRIKKWAKVRPNSSKL